ncbi:MAG: hypothetical protein ACYCU5_04875 [Actinomycetes bacterium]
MPDRDVGWSSGNASAEVIEGVGMLGGCADGIDGPSTYSYTSVTNTSVTNQTATNVAYGFKTVTEVTPQSGCGSISAYETLDSYVDNLMSNAAGLPWYFGEDSPVGWGNPTGGLATDNAVLGDATPAPQAYSSAKITRINAECATYGNCTNLVTVDTAAAAPTTSRSG